ncbi:unnamed protein product, partial [Adineta steineri]
MPFLYLSLSVFLITCIVAVQKVTLPDADRSYLIELLPQTYKDISADRAQKLVYELENFYTGIRENLWADCGPPYEIDKAFHLHIINTRMYEAFSQVTFGRFVHHSPFWSAHPAPNDLLERCGDQVKKLRDHDVPIIYEYLWMPPIRGKCENDLVDKEDERPYYCDL